MHPCVCVCFSEMEEDRHWISLEILIQPHPLEWFPYYRACSVMGPVVWNPLLVFVVSCCSDFLSVMFELACVQPTII